MFITPEQIRAARALLRLEQHELARRAGISVVTVPRLEATEGTARVAAATLHDVREVLEQAGAEFIQDGVRSRSVRPGADALFEQLKAISLQSAEQLRAGDQLIETDLYGDDGLPARLPSTAQR